MGDVKYTTETGSFYVLDLEAGYWRKNSDPWEQLWEYAAVPDWGDRRAEVLEAGLIPWSREHGEMLTLPKEGECLYIMSRGVWWLSTPVVAIEREED